MFYTLLGASIVVSALVAACVTALFHKSVHRIYAIISNDAVARACSIYVVFASLVVGGQWRPHVHSSPVPKRTVKPRWKTRPDASGLGS